MVFVSDSLLFVPGTVHGVEVTWRCGSWLVSVKLLSSDGSTSSFLSLPSVYSCANIFYVMQN
jgi:hypothetical protein